jgi:hypothetical protein
LSEECRRWWLANAFFKMSSSRSTRRSSSSSWATRSPSVRAAGPACLTTIVGDNSADGEHRAGYNGVWDLRHAAGSRSVFVPAVAGLNLEHIVTGEHLDDTKTFFEPRNAPMSLRQISDMEAELHQPPTPTFHLESWTRFRVIAPHYLDMSFRCVPHESVFPRG